MTTPEIYQALKTGAAISGLRNCHVPNVTSLVLRERLSPQEGMVRIFYAEPNHPLQYLYRVGGEFNVAAHNHRQDLSLEVLFGTVDNWILTEREESPKRLAEYSFNSGILGEMSVAILRLLEVDITRYSMFLGRPFDMLASHIHTVTVASRSAAWVVREGALSPAPTLAYNKMGWKPSVEGLYIPMSDQELRIACSEILDGIDTEGKA